MHGVALDYTTMQKIADELEVGRDWLFGTAPRKDKTLTKKHIRIIENYLSHIKMLGQGPTYTLNAMAKKKSTMALLHIRVC